MAERQRGMVKWFDARKGYGFIQREDGEDVFVHASAIRGDARTALAEDERVEFEIVQDNKGPRAEDVVLLD